MYFKLVCAHARWAVSVCPSLDQNSDLKHCFFWLLAVMHDSDISHSYVPSCKQHLIIMRYSCRHCQRIDFVELTQAHRGQSRVERTSITRANEPIEIIQTNTTTQQFEIQLSMICHYADKSPEPAMWQQNAFHYI